MDNTAIDYDALEQQRNVEVQHQFQKKIEANAKSGARIDSLRHSILSHVVGQNYDLARSEILRFVELKAKYPNFAKRVGRYVQHCTEIIFAIETKRSFPALSSLSMSKQQEFFDKVMDHFEELKFYLKKIEYIEKEEKLFDIKSTVWVLRSLTYCTIGLFAFFLTKDLFGGMGSSMNSVFDHSMDRLFNFIFSFLP